MLSGLPNRARRTLLTAFLVLLPAVAQASAIPFEIGGSNLIASIQGTVTSFQAALGNPNNGSVAGPLGTGHREINWDGGGGLVAPGPGGTPFTTFLNTRGALITTPGSGFQQAVPGADLGDASYA